MARIKVDFNKPVMEQVAKTRDITGKMTGNPNFPTPDPALASMDTAANELETAYNEAQNNDREKKAVMRIKRKALKALIVLLADYVQKTSGGDEEKILSSGFGVRKTPAPLGVPETPQALKVLSATHLGELQLVWRAVKGAKSYVIEYTISPVPVLNADGGLSTRARFKATNLQEGTKYWFRVMAVNAAGEGGWSDWAAGRTL